jgi:hypothetical protein
MHDVDCRVLVPALVLSMHGGRVACMAAALRCLLSQPGAGVAALPAPRRDVDAQQQLHDNCPIVEC